MAIGKCSLSCCVTALLFIYLYGWRELKGLEVSVCIVKEPLGRAIVSA